MTMTMTMAQWWLLPVLLLCAGLFPLFPAVGQGKVIDVEHADSLVGRTVDGQQVRELIGSVRFSQERVRVSCDRALQYLQTGRVELAGNVVVRDDSVILMAPRGVYHRDTRRAEAFDEVELNDGQIRVVARYGQYFIDPKIAAFRSEVMVRDASSTLTADSLTYFRTERRSVAVGNVSVENASDDVTIRGGRFENTVAPAYSKMTLHPVLVQFQAGNLGKIETLVVRSRLMESFRDSVRRMVASDSVEITRGFLSGVAGRAVFFTEGDSIHLRAAPIVWYGASQIAGDSINVYLELRRLRRVAVLGNTMAISRTDPRKPERFDQLTGETMQLLFADQELQQIEVDVQATSIYHLYDDTTANGLNKTSGDRLVLSFRGRKMDAIAVTGGVEGTYVPENLLEGHESDYALPGFTWIEDRPRPRPDDFRHTGERK